MEKVEKSLILIILGIFLATVLQHCTKYKEEAPFFDGLVLEYRIGRFKTIYNVQTLDNNRFKITETRKRGVLSDRVKEFFVDVHGKVYKSRYKPYKGKFSPIWLPVHEMKIGDTFKYLEGDRYTITKKDKWKKWDVLVVKNVDFDAERYFDVNTGYWVGLFGKSSRGAITIVLVNTNADIPVEE